MSFFNLVLEHKLRENSDYNKKINYFPEIKANYIYLLKKKDVLIYYFQFVTY